MLELSNPCVFISLGIVDHISLTSGALLGLLIWLGVKVRRKADVLLFGLGSALVTGMFMPVLCSSHRGLPAPARSRSSPAWELSSEERSYHSKCWVTSVLALLPPLFWQKTGPGSPTGSRSPCASGRNGGVSMQSQDHRMVKQD